MRALIQRVSGAKVQIKDKTISSINDGLLIFIGIYSNDTIDDINSLSGKVIIILRQRLLNLYDKLRNNLIKCIASAFI